MPRTKSPGKPSAKNGAYVSVNVRLRREVVDLVDRYVAEDNHGKDIPQATRISMIKQILQLGLDAKKKEHPVDGNGGGS
jgi:hypothetical protein